MHARKTVRSAFVVVLSLSLLVLASTSAAAADGDLDLTFDGDGRVVTDFGGNDGLGGMAIQADGKIVVAGASGPDSSADFTLARYTATGALDPTFDGDGKVTTDFGAREVALAVAVQSDGRIVAAGSSAPPTGGGSNNFALARYNADGSLDPTFGGDGTVLTDVGRYGYATDLAIQADGKIVATGSIGDAFAPPFSFDFVLARYNADGSLDTTFDGDGKVSTDLGAWDLADSVKVQTDGKIVVAGSSGTGGSPTPTAYDFALARYNRDGTLDSTFDGDGKVLTDFGGFDRAFSVAIQSGSRIVAAGMNNSDFVLARYKPDGSLDPSFDVDGRVTTNFGASDAALGVAIQADDKIVAAGYRNPGGTAVQFALARYLDGGTLDPTFGAGGKVLTSFDGVAFGDDVAIAPDGKIVVAGDVSDPEQSDFALARYVSEAPVNHPPDCSTVSPSPATLRTPNHWFRPVALGGAVDSDGDSVTITIRAVTQDEPLRWFVRGHAVPDAIRGFRSNVVWLRAERSGVGDGRVYRVWFTANDGKGGSCWGVVKVGVPRGARAAIDSAPPSFNSFGR